MATRLRPPSRRLAIALALAAAVVLLAVVALASGGGPSEQPPATGAARLVPGDALAYIHVSTDLGRPAVKRALALIERLPSYGRLLATIQGRLTGFAGGDVRRWLGREAALALLNTPTSTAGSLIVLDVRDRSAAQAALGHAGAAPAGSYRGTTIEHSSPTTDLAFLGRYLVVGQPTSVRTAIDVFAGATPSLASSPAYDSAAAGEPAGRVLDAYASGAGVRRLLAPQGGLLGALGVLLYQPALAGVSVSASAGSRAVDVRVHSALDPTLARLNANKPTLFSPSLESVVPAGSMLLLDVTGLDKLAPRVLNAGAAGGIAGRIGPLLQRLGGALSAQGFDVRGITSLFAAESIVAITAAGHKPALVVVARTHDEAKTRAELAALELPLQQLFPPPSSGPGQAPLFKDRQVDGIDVHQLALAPGLEFDYAVSNGLVILSTALDGITGVVKHARALSDEPSYQTVLAARPERVSSLLFLDFSQLLSLGEQTGLQRSARYRALRGDLETIRAVGLDSTSGEADSTAELHLLIP